MKLGEKHHINGKTVHDPPMRADRLCVVCRKWCPTPPDPFCSSTCCRQYHGVSFG